MRRYIAAIAIFVSAVALITVGTRVIELDDHEPTFSLATSGEHSPVQGGTSARTGIKGIVEYTVRGPDGKIKERWGFFDEMGMRLPSRAEIWLKQGRTLQS